MHNSLTIEQIVDGEFPPLALPAEPEPEPEPEPAPAPEPESDSHIGELLGDNAALVRDFCAQSIVFLRLNLMSHFYEIGAARARNRRRCRGDG